MNDLVFSGGAVEVSRDDLWLCSPLEVVARKKLCLIHNLHELNRSLARLSFKYRDIKVAVQLFENGEHFFSFDSKVHTIMWRSTQLLQNV